MNSSQIKNESMQKSFIAWEPDHAISTVFSILVMFNRNMYCTTTHYGVFCIKAFIKGVY